MARGAQGKTTDLQGRLILGWRPAGPGIDLSKACQVLRQSSTNWRRETTIMVTIWHARASVPPQRGRFGTGSDLGSHALRDWTRSKSWEEVTPGAPTGAAALKPENSNSRSPTGEARGLRDKECVTGARPTRPCFFLRQTPSRFPAISCRIMAKPACGLRRFAPGYSDFPRIVAGPHHCTRS